MKKVVTRIKHIRIGDVQKIADNYFLVVKHGNKQDYIDLYDLIEQITDKQVSHIVFSEEKK